MSMESEQKKLETRDEEKRVSSVPKMIPGLLQAPDSDWPRAGPSTELQASTADEPSGKCPVHLHREHAVKHEQELEPVLVREEDKAEEKEKEWGCGGRAEALLATLDAGSTINPELVLDLRVKKSPDIAFIDQGANADPCTSSKASAGEGASDECPEEGPSCGKIRGKQLALSTCSGKLDIPIDEHPSTQQSTATHQQNITGASTFSCNICVKLFSNITNFIEHLKTHRTERPFQCEVCKILCGNKCELKIHYRTHTGEKPYSCDFCGKRFNIQGNLTVHRRIHTGEKPYSCDICGQRFTSQGNVVAHRRIHTREKPYMCIICNRRFSQLGHLQKHKRVHTGARPYE